MPEPRSGRFTYSIIIRRARTPSAPLERRALRYLGVRLLEPPPIVAGSNWRLGLKPQLPGLQEGIAWGGRRPVVAQSAFFLGWPDTKASMSERRRTCGSGREALVFDEPTVDEAPGPGSP